MKIALLTKRFLDVSETFIYLPLQIFIKSGLFVGIFSLQRRNKELFPAKNIFSLDMLSAKKEREELLRGDLGRSQYFVEKMRQEAIELIHAHYGYMGIYALQLKKSLKIPLVTSFYGLDVYQHSRSPFYRWQLKRLFKQGDLFTVCSQKMQQDLIKLGAPKDKVMLLYGGVDVSKYPFAKSSIDYNKELTTVLMCGRFVEKKGFAYAIKAFRKLSADNIALNIIGSGPLESELRSLAKGDKRITFLGNKGYEDYMTELKHADILLTPSVTAKNGDREGLPTVLIEASALGTIIVATKHSGIPEIVKNGYLVEERDILGLTNTLTEAIASKSQWEALARAQRIFVEDNFDMEKQTQKLFLEFKRLLR